jgi:transcriptional regulator with XRE-family HTH domain
VVNTNKVKARIMELGLTQEDVAKKLGIDYSTFNVKINNNRRFYVDEVAKLCELLNIKTSTELREYFGFDFLVLTDSRQNATEDTVGGV